MKKETSNTIHAGDNDLVDMGPFVNEECGDTMWDRVLKEASERATDSTAIQQLSFRY